MVALAEGYASPPGNLRAVLAQVADPRAPRGVRHRLATVLTLAACAVLAGARSFVAVAEGRPIPTRPPRGGPGRAGAERVDVSRLFKVGGVGPSRRWPS